MKRWMSGICVMALLGLVAAPAVGQNLLQNPGFEDDVEPDSIPDFWTLSGAAEYDTDADYYSVPPCNGTDLVGASSNSGTSIGTVGQSLGLPNGGVPRGYDLTLSFWATFYDDSPGSPSSVTGGIYVDGQPDPVASVTVTALETGYPVPACTEGTIGWAGLALSDITVEFELVGDGSTAAYWGVAIVDDVSLTEAAACPAQHTTSSVDPPASNDNNSDAIDVTINGTNLDQVTAAKLVMGATELVGTGLTPAVGGLSMTVDFPTTGAEAGTYHVITEQTGCLSQVLVDAFTVTCPDGTVLTGALPNLFQIPPPLGVAETIIISGSVNLDAVATVSLVHETGAPTIAGSITAQTPTQIDANFDLSAAQIGLYDVVCDRTDGCPDAVLEDEIEIASVGTNLILNGDFEVYAGSTNPTYPDGPVNARIWFGDYPMMGVPNAGCTEPCDELAGSWGSRTWWIAPRSPVQTFEFSIGGASGTTQTYQTVAVSAGASVVFEGYVHTGPADGGETNTITVTLYDNSAPSGTVLDTVTVDQTSAAGPNWYGVTLSGSAVASGYVTVEFTTSCSAPYGLAGVVHGDDYNLYSSVACATQHTVTSIAEATGNHDENIILHMTGTDLNLVTGVKLLQIESQVIIPGTITAQGPTYLWADMPIGTQGAPLGFYTVLTEQEDCVGQTRVDEFEVVCRNPSVFIGVAPSMLEAPQGTVEFRVTGTDLVDGGQSELDSVSLVMGNTVLTDFSPTPDGLDLLITLDLSAAPGGHYALKGTRPDDQCADPDDVHQAFELYAPCDNLLVNGDFELNGPKGVNVDLDENPVSPTYDYWHRDTTGGGFSLRYNETLNGMGSAIEGDNYAGAHTGNGDLARAYQEVTGVIPGAALTLVGFMGGCSADGGAGEPDKQFDHRIRLWDGAMDTTMLGEFILDKGDHCADWISFSIVASPTSGSTVTVEWGYQRGLSGWAIPATHVDDLKLCPPVSCNDPFADFDEDGDVDQDDLGVMQACITGTGGGILPGCDCADATGDGDVTEPDYNAFEACASGPNVNADITCDDP